VVSGLPGVVDEYMHAVKVEARRRDVGDVMMDESKRRSDQLPLFTQNAEGRITDPLALPELHAEASLDLAMTWFRRDLEARRRPLNTIDSYMSDLGILARLAGNRTISDISHRDIARYLGDAQTRSTRKRRLTSVRGLYNFLRDVRILDRDPSDGFTPHHIELRLPHPLSADEQRAMLDAAGADESWSAVAIYLMMRLGLSRAELLALKRDDIDRSDEDRPRVFIFTDVPGKPSKERVLQADAVFSDLYGTYLEHIGSASILFSVGPPAVNGMVDRVRKVAGIERPVTPQTLRHTFAVDQARAGADQKALLAALGLADDPRNRESVDRYLKLANPVARALDP
jgi:site-specific recombinase XerD